MTNKTGKPRWNSGFRELVPTKVKHAAAERKRRATKRENLKRVKQECLAAMDVLGKACDEVLKK